MFNVRVELRSVPAKEKRRVYAALRKRMVGNGFTKLTGDKCFELQDAEYTSQTVGWTLDDALEKAKVLAEASGYDFSVRAIKTEEMKQFNLKPADLQKVREEAVIRRPFSAAKRRKT